MLGPSTSPLGIPRSVIENTLSFSGSDVNFNGKVGIGKTSPTAKLDILDATLAGSGSLAASALNIAQTWNTTGNPTAIKLNVTNTASGASSLLMDLQVGGSSKVSVDKNGNIIYPQAVGGIWFSGNAVHGGIRNTVYGLSGFELVANSERIAAVGVGGVTFNNGKYIGFRSDSNLHVGATTRLVSDADYILAQRNGANAQTFRIYNTYTDASNYERGFLTWDTNVLKIGAEAFGTGTNRNIEFVAGGSTRMTIASTGNVGIGTATPTAKLHIQGAMAGGVDGADTVGLRLTNTNGGTWRISSGAGGINNSTFTIFQVGQPQFTGERFVITSAGNIGIGTTTPSEKLDVVGNVKISGHLTAATKSFLIDNPVTGGKLQYGVVESNEHSVYVRGKTSEDTITLPDHWDWLVDENSVTVQVTPIGKPMSLWVIEQNNKTVKIGGVERSYNYTIYGTRKDVPELKVELEK